MAYRKLLQAAVLAGLAGVVFATVAFAAPAPPFDTNAKCLECHSVAGSGAFTKVDFDVPAVDYTKCASCHAALSSVYLHEHNIPGAYFPGSNNCNAGGCHAWPGYAGQLPPQVNIPGLGWFVSSSSPSATVATLHSRHVNGSWPGADPNIQAQCGRCHRPSACSVCHVSNPQHTAHAVPTYPAVMYTQATGGGTVTSAVTCVNPSCHALAVASAPQFVPTCSSCHPTRTAPHGYESADHTATVGGVVNPGGKVCSDCHSMQLYPEHQRATSSSKAADCGACHPSPRNSFPVWNKTCEQGGCHAAGSSTERHSAQAAKHVAAPAGAACADCHPGDLAVVHTSVTSTVDPARSSCTLCHSTTEYPATNDCTVCHFTVDDHPYPPHVSPWTLAGCGDAGCHTPNLSGVDLMSAHKEKNPAFDCASCHQSTDPAVQAAIASGNKSCDACHAGVSETNGHRAVHWANPQLVEGGAPKYAYWTGSAPGGAYTTDCAQCHVSNLVDEHLGIIDPETGNAIRQPRRDRFGTALDCASCHNSLDANVAGAIASGFTNCDACHVVHGPIAQIHRSGFATDTQGVDCSQCHDANLSVQHNGAYSVTTPSGRVLVGCSVCHEYWEGARGQQVEDAIADGVVLCAGCHSPTHPDLGSHSATNAASRACAQCHDAGGTTDIDVRAVHTGAGVGPCAVCHSNPARVPDITTKLAECASCHSTEGTDYHRGLPGKHTYDGMSPDCLSAGCHASNVLPQTHEPYLGRYPQYASTCELCHANQDPGRIPPTATAACSSCHTVHGDLEALHQAPDSEECVACHETGDVRTVHAGSSKGQCAVCHDNPTQVPVLPTSTKCVNCHAALTPPDPNHYEAVPHTASDGTQYGYACSTCHKLGMKPEHFKASSGPVSCVQCHQEKVDGIAGAWDKTCAQCHTVRHGGYTAAHASTQTACAGSGCHNVSDVTAIHSAASTSTPGGTLSACRVCHTDSDAVPATTDCYGCHAGHGDLTVAHTAVASGACTACHETGDVRTVHAGSSKGQCAVCHDNPTQVPVLPSSPECVNCHAALSPPDPNHYEAVPHTASSQVGNCNQCHYLEMKPEHSKPSSGPVSCVQCHEQKVDGFTQAWNKQCESQCHAMKHGQQAARHQSPRSECGGSGCHAVGDVSAVHSALPGGGCPTCHKSASQPATTIDCLSSGCHQGSTPSHKESHDTGGRIDAGCYGCHFQYLDDEHLALGLECATCHSSTDQTVKDAIAANDRRCLTCHPNSAHNARQAQEFAPGNASLHRVYSDLPGMRSSFMVNGQTYTMTLPSASSFLKSGYTTSSMVSCRDCHTYSGTSGPHGAQMKVNIDPAYPNPYKAFGGGSTNTAQLSPNSATGMSMREKGSTPAGIICEKCHDLLNGSTWSNVVHKEHDDRANEGGYCNHCHIAVPHGWGRPRMLGYTTDDARYRTTSGGLQRFSLKSYTPSNWDKSDCGAGCSSSRHPLNGSSWPNNFGGGSTPPPNPTNGTVSGKVTSAAGGAAVSGASVSLNNGANTTAGSDGMYVLAGVPAGTYTMTVSAAGYTTWSGSVVVTAGQTTSRDVSLSQAAMNLALNKTATASSTDGSNSPARAVDGSTSTYWRSSSGGTQWLRVDLGSSTSVSKVVINWNGSYYARAYRIETSTDGSSWSTRYSTSSGGSGTRTHTFSAVNARYVRIYCTSANYSNYRINEFEVWNQ